MTTIEGEAINPRDPRPANLPAEWDAPSEDQEARLEAAAQRVTFAPGVSASVPTPEYQRVMDEIAGTRWFLLRNVWGWKSGHAGRQGAREAYYTAYGIERPFRGTEEIHALFRDRYKLDDPAGIVREALKIGAIEPITTARAHSLCTRIMLRSHGRVDLLRITDRRKEQPHARALSRTL